MHMHGYDSAYRKRPRAVSKDGCGIFWRRNLFRLEGQDHLDFVDQYDPETDWTSKDRCSLFVLLRHVHSGERVLFISTHLARNPEDCTQTKTRAKQACNPSPCNCTCLCAPRRRYKHTMHSNMRSTLSAIPRRTCPVSHPLLTLTPT